MRKAVSFQYTSSKCVLTLLANSPFDRVRKIGRQSRDWIAQYADNYKKKPRLERAIKRFQERYQNALSADGCKKGKCSVLEFKLTCT